MIEEETFRDMASQSGFKINAIFGDYAEAEFDPDSSPVMIWELERGEA
jgi:hypothetical protein